MICGSKKGMRVLKFEIIFLASAPDVSQISAVVFSY